MAVPKKKKNQSIKKYQKIFNITKFSKTNQIDIKKKILGFGVLTIF